MAAGVARNPERANARRAAAVKQRHALKLMPPPSQASIDAIIASNKRRAAIARHNQYERPDALAVVRDREDLKPQWVDWDETWLEKTPAVSLENTWALCRCYGVAFVWSKVSRNFYFQIAGMLLEKDRCTQLGMAWLGVWCREHKYDIKEKELLQHLHLLSAGKPTMEDMCKTKAIDV